MKKLLVLFMILAVLVAVTPAAAATRSRLERLTSPARGRDLPCWRPVPSSMAGLCQPDIQGSPRPLYDF